MSPRDHILARLRAVTGAATPGRPPVGPRPALSGDGVEGFVRAAEKSAAEVEIVNGETQIVPAVESYRAAAGIDEYVLAPALQSLSWPDCAQSGMPSDGYRLGVAAARAGIAETGTLLFASDADNPANLLFLPETLIAILHEADIVAHFEDAVSRLRASDGFPPRAVNWVTGPSRTADIEQTIQLGAHGPRVLRIIVVS